MISQAKYTKPIVGLSIILGILVVLSVTLGGYAKLFKTLVTTTKAKSPIHSAQINLETSAVSGLHDFLSPLRKPHRVLPLGMNFDADQGEAGKFIDGVTMEGFSGFTRFPMPEFALNQLPHRWIDSIMTRFAPIKSGPFVYVTNQSSNNVSVIDTTTNTVVDTVPVGFRPTGVAITPDGAFAYVADTQTNPYGISVIATANNTVTAKVAIGGGTDHIAITPNGAFAYVTNSPSSVAVINTATNTLVATVPVGSGPTGVAITPNGAFAYVTHGFSNNISVIATTSNSVIATIPVADYPLGVAITPNGALAYVTHRFSDNMSVVSTVTNSVIRTIALRDYPYGVAITPNGAFAYIANSLSDNVSVVATATNTVVATIPVGDTPTELAITPDGKFVYVTNLGSDPASPLPSNVSVIATATNTVVATISVGKRPIGVAITPDLTGNLAPIALNPTIVTGGQIATGTVNLRNPAPKGGALITLSSGDTSVATVPESIIITEGGIGKTFAVATKIVTSTSTVDISATYSGETKSARLAVTPQLADLQVSAVGAPSTTWTDRAFDLSWTDANSGRGRAKGPWGDKVFLSKDDQLGNDTLLAEFPFSQFLDPDQNAARTQIITIPRSAVASDGPYFLIVLTDAGNAVEESNENNNWRARPITLRRTLLPDLIVESIEAPNTASFDQTVGVRWRVKDIGNASTDASEWRDRLFLSRDRTPSVDDALQLDVLNTSYLNAGEGYVAFADVRIPRGLSGTYYIIVKTDNGNTVLEENEENNSRDQAINIQIPPLPDLQVPLVQAPEEGFAGQPILINWRVENRGNSNTPPDQRTWFDAIYLSREQNLNLATARLIGSRNRDGGLQQGEGYTISGFSVDLPRNIVGDWCLFVWADYQNSVYEFSNENNNTNYDRRHPIRILATPPDLIISSFTTPGTGTAARQITANWTVRNQGAFEAGPDWVDTVYLSADSTLDPTIDRPLATVQHTSSLGPGLSYTASATVTLPACLTGAYYLFVITDSRNQIFEFDPGYDAEKNNFSQPRAIQITAIPSDLQTTAVSNPAAGNAGELISVTWTVANRGGGPTAEGNWIDRVYLSPSPTFNVNTSLLAGSFARAGALAPNESYTRMENISIPARAQGAYYVLVWADASNAVEECGNENNNIGASPATINVNNDVPDLMVLGITASSSLFAGQTILMQWRVGNVGPAAVRTPAWNDAVYFSTDRVLDGGDRRVATALIGGPLNMAATYAGQAQVTIPSVSAGTYYLIIAADSDNYVFEGQREDNNTNYTAISINIANVDLRVTTVDAPAEAFSGQEMSVSWTVTNAGTMQTFVSQWTDYVILSRDQILDTTDQTIGYRVHNGMLNGGGSDTATLSVTVPPGLAGPYYVFIRTDWHNQVVETDETNNAGIPDGVLIQLPPLVNLTATNVNIPTSGSPGEQATFQWTVQNVGRNTAIGRWRDAVYLSKDQVWDIGDALVGGVDHSGPLAAAQAYTGVLSATLPAVDPGQYYVIIRTDVRNNVREDDETNNTATSTGRTMVDVVELTLGVPHKSTLRTGQERYHKVNVPGGETLLFTLDAERDDSSTELFTRYGSMVSRSTYDYLFNQPYAADQEVLVPNTLAGQYYSLTRSEYISPTAGDSTPFSIKAEIIPFSIRSVSPNKGGNAGQVTIRIEGAKFNEITEVSLIGGKQPIKSIWAERTSTNQLYATFDLRGMSPGMYGVRALSQQVEWKVDDKGEVYDENRVYGDFTLAGSFEVLPGGGAVQNARLLLPSSVRRGSQFDYFLEVSNEGLNDLLVPVLLIASPNERLISTSSQIGPNSPSQIQIIVQGAGRRDVLAPGERVVVQLHGLAGQGPSTKLILRDVESSNAPLDWDNLEVYYRDTSTATEWQQVWSNFKAIVGNTWGQLHNAMRQAAIYAGQGRDVKYFTGTDLILTLLAKAKSDTMEFGNLRLTGPYRGPDFPRGNEIDPNTDCSIYKGPPYTLLLDALYRKMDPDAYFDPPRLDTLTDGIRGRELLSRWPRFRETYYTYLKKTPFKPSIYDFGHPISNEAQDLKETKDAIQNLLKNIIYPNLLVSCPEKLGLMDDGQSVRISISKLVLPSYLDVDPNTGQEKVKLNFKYKVIRGSTPGLLVGGTESGSIYGPDKRLVSGDLILTRHNDDCGKLISVEVRTDPNLTFEIIDSFDFCPGLRGGIVASIATVPLAVLEANGRAVAVPVYIRFKVLEESLEISGEYFPADCDKQQCLLQPPAGQCAPLCKNSCRKGLNGAEGGQRCDGPFEEIPEVATLDPNDKVGPAGFGPQRFAALRQDLPYTINFENVPTAQATARQVRIIDQLSPSLDWRTFRLKEVGLSRYRIPVPENRAFFQNRIQLGEDFGNLIADISAGLDIATGRVTWALTAIDPKTGEQPNSALLGLLPPNDNTGRGQGFVTYTIQPKSTAPTGTQLTNNATIIFDNEEPIITNTVTNTLDADPPVSAIGRLPVSSPETFMLRWSGTDITGGSGLRSYDIYVSENDGPYQPFIIGTTETSAQFTGVVGKTYRFYSIARDNAGNVETAPSTPNAATEIRQPIKRPPR